MTTSKHISTLPSKVTNQNVIIIRPSIKQKIQYLTDIDHLLDPLSLEKKGLFFPISECPKIKGIIGSHSSFMVYSKNESVSFTLTPLAPIRAVAGER